MQNLVRILLVDDSRADAQLLRDVCRDEPACTMVIRHVEYMVDAVNAIKQGGVDVVLLDLILPDSAPAETLAQGARWAGTVPVIIMTGLHDDVMASKAIFSGIQDYLIKGQIDYRTLERSIRYARDRLSVMQ